MQTQPFLSLYSVFDVKNTLTTCSFSVVMRRIVHGLWWMLTNFVNILYTSVMTSWIKFIKYSCLLCIIRLNDELVWQYSVSNIEMLKSERSKVQVYVFFLWVVVVEGGKRAENGWCLYNNRNWRICFYNMPSVVEGLTGKCTFKDGKGIGGPASLKRGATACIATSPSQLVLLSSLLLWRILHGGPLTLDT